MRVMGLDVGDRTIGVALSDENGNVSMPLKVIRRTESMRKDINEIRKLVEENNVKTVVVGMPIMLAGAPGVQAGKVQEFVEELRKRVRVPVETWDERLTTVEAERMLIEAEQSRERRKAVVDMIAASLILQSYLDRQKRKAQGNLHDERPETA